MANTHILHCDMCGKRIQSAVTKNTARCQPCRRIVNASSPRVISGRRYKRVCQTCGVDYLAQKRGGKFCSLPCAARGEKKRGGRNVPAERICLMCGAAYFNSRHDRKKYCGDVCKYVAKHGASCSISFPECASCFAPMSSRSRGKYCNEVCAWRTKGQRHRVWFPSCLTCGRLFCCRNGRSKRCHMCRILHDYEMKAAYERRKVSKLVDYVGARDKWKCGICGKRVSGEPFVHGNYWSKTVDHIVPESEGKRLGWTRDEIDDPANLRVAHMRCNALRSANGGGEQLALVG